MCRGELFWGLAQFALLLGHLHYPCLKMDIFSGRHVAATFSTAGYLLIFNRQSSVQAARSIL